MTLMDETTTTVINHDILCLGVTNDYKIVVDSLRGGYKMVANRRIKKGGLIQEDSLEFNFSDVREGDHMWLGGNPHDEHDGACSSSKEEKLASSNNNKDKDVVPERIPVTRDMLLRTHGVNYIIKKSPTEVVLRHYLEVPTMFVNHSCEPTMHCLYDGEDVATRDIEAGDELTVDYATGFHDDYTVVDECWCGAPSCRGKVLGFSSLSAEDQEKLFPTLSPATIAAYQAGIGQGPPVREFDELIPRPTAAAGDDGAAEKVMRLMWPGPSWAEANVMVKKDDANANEYGLCAAKNVRKGKPFYEFWRQPWPRGEKTLIDMVFSAPVSRDEEGQKEGDIQEGTVVRLDASKCGSYRNAKGGQLMFSGWEMLNAHSCDPNVVYRNRECDENEKWQMTYAAKNIKKGDRITMDWNCFTWDRRGGAGDERDDAADMTVCHCGASNCAGTRLGFKYLSPEAQTERLAMTWLRKTGANDNCGVGGEALAGKALSPYVQAMWRNMEFPHDDDDAIATSCSDSSINDKED